MFVCLTPERKDILSSGLLAILGVIGSMAIIIALLTFDIVNNTPYNDLVNGVQMTNNQLAIFIIMISGANFSLFGLALVVFSIYKFIESKKVT